MKLLSLMMLLITSSCIYGEVLVFTFAFNRPDFIEIQYKTLKKLLLDEYKFTVFNDAKDPNLEQQIKDTCAQLDIQCIRIPQEIHSRPYLPRLPREDWQYPTVRNVNVVQYALDTMGFDHEDIVVLLDSDMFLVKPFSAREFLKDHELGGAATGNGYVTFLWHALAILDMSKMPNKRTLTFNCGEVDGHPIDGGGHSYYYIKNNPVQVRWMNHHYSGNMLCENCKSTQQPVCQHNTAELSAHGFDEDQIQFLQHANDVEFFHKGTFLHYRSGTNWNHKSEHYHRMKTEALNIYIENILN